MLDSGPIRIKMIRRISKQAWTMGFDTTILISLENVSLIILVVQRVQPIPQVMLVMSYQCRNTVV